MALAAIHIPSSRKANKALIAEWFEVSVPTVDAWIRRGCPYVQRGDKGQPWIFDLLRVAEWRVGYASGGVSDAKSPENMPPKERRDWYEGEKVRVALELQSGNLLTLDDYRLELARILKQVANTLETLPDTLERKCALPPDALIAVQEEIDKERAMLVAALLEREGTT